MPISEFRVYLDGKAADKARLNSFSQIKVDQAIGMASEAELHIDIGTDSAGRWFDLEEDFAQPFHRVRLEIKVGSGDYVPLIDGPVVGQRFELSASPDESKLILVTQDDSVLLNRDEYVELFENLAPHEIARRVFQDHGLRAEVDSTPGASTGLTRYTVQRGTAMQLLRELARRHGMFVYIRPAASPGSSIGFFKRPVLARGNLPELLLPGAKRNVNKFSAQFDALRPMTSRVANVRIKDKSILSSETTTSDIPAQGDEPVHSVVTPGMTVLARTREDITDLDAASVAAVNQSSWAYSATAETVADIYSGVLTPYQVVRVTGVGGYLSGDYLISHVTHVIDDDSYKQQFTLRRNARSAGTGAGAGSAPQGVF